MVQDRYLARKCKVNNKLILGLLAMVLLYCDFGFSQENRLRAGVAPGLANGMYARLINYIGDNLGLEVDIVEVPLKRRLIMLQNGQLDLAVGLLKTPERVHRFRFIESEYTIRESEDRLYLLQSNATDFDNGRLVNNKVIAVLRGSNIYQSFAQVNPEQLFETISLAQSIDLLLKGRIDYFMYAKDAADKMLAEQAVTDLVYESPLRPDRVKSKKVYMAISKHSFLNNFLPELIQVATTLNRGEYDKLHQLHYGKG